MAEKAKNQETQVEEPTQGGAEQPQETPVVEQPQAETPAPQTQTAPGATVSETKQTPSVIAQTNQAKAAELRTKYAAQLDAIGNNMSEKIRFLNREGLSKGDISRVLQIQFQFVRNVVFNYDMKREKEARDAEAKRLADLAKAQAPASAS